MVKPGGTGRPRLAISARPAPLPPRRLRMSARPSALPPPNAKTHLGARDVDARVVSTPCEARADLGGAPLRARKGDFLLGLRTGLLAFAIVRSVHHLTK